MSDCIGTGCKAEALMSRIRKLEAERDSMLAALIGVVKVADRKTDEFDAARAAIDAARREA